MKLAWSTLILWLVVGGEAQQHSLHIPNYGAVHSNHHSIEPAVYDFSYQVNDGITGDVKAQEESRRGDSVRGRYSLIDADGSTRTVEYSVDSDSGFNAVVRRDGDQLSVPAVDSRSIQNNHYQNRGRQTPSDVYSTRSQSGRVFNHNSRTRLAQDARTGNVVDLHSGFGAQPYLSNVISQNNDFRRQETTSGSYENDQIQSRSPYHNSQHNRLSTAPMHFPGMRSNYNFNLGLSRFSNMPVNHQRVDVRMPTALIPNQESMNNEEELPNEQNNFPNNINPALLQRPVHHGEINGPSPITIQPPQMSHETNQSRIAAITDSLRRSGIGLNMDNAWQNWIPEQTNNVYPASTVPLDPNTPVHVFTGARYINGVSPVFNIHDLTVGNQFLDAVPHYEEPVGVEIL